jgi:DNA-binding transcriptional ArsR family regulator
MTLTALDQVWALADPLRVRMLGAFAEERTTRQVAEILEEKPTRLYHHLKALASAGLIRKTRTRRNRGTLETYYRAVAGSFRADPSLFAPPGTKEATDSIGTMIGTMLDQTKAELNALVASGGEDNEVQEEAHFAFFEVRAPERDMKKLRARIDTLVKGLSEEQKKGTTPAPGAGARDRRYRLSIAFFPLDLPKR